MRCYECQGTRPRGLNRRRFGTNLLLCRLQGWLWYLEIGSLRIFKSRRRAKRRYHKRIKGHVFMNRIHSFQYLPL